MCFSSPSAPAPAPPPPAAVSSVPVLAPTPYVSPEAAAQSGGIPANGVSRKRLRTDLTIPTGNGTTGAGLALPGG